MFDEEPKTREKITCNDGTTVSVQASWFHYCSPQNNVGPYSLVEVGFPSVKPYFMMQYAQDPENPTDTVYSYVPARLVHNFIRTHCGIRSGELPPMIDIAEE